MLQPEPLDDRIIAGESELAGRHRLPDEMYKEVGPTIYMLANLTNLLKSEVELTKRKIQEWEDLKGNLTAEQNAAFSSLIAQTLQPKMDQALAVAERLEGIMRV